MLKLIQKIEEQLLSKKKKKKGVILKTELSSAEHLCSELHWCNKEKDQVFYALLENKHKYEEQTKQPKTPSDLDVNKEVVCLKYFRWYFAQ